jgi:hypothetical protein
MSGDPLHPRLNIVRHTFQFGVDQRVQRFYDPHGRFIAK